ncbi:hypothetical protein WN55_01175 [Dufourea novaeangliae]|uniref:Uncharacterized protein n=1 Tax=Dufourea novaeangliae TaxID=178035 RepID=A0A154PEA1_DUFNO|nr:hypothetical protein WN55_01175 [Dufourea novaeangliae]
MHYNFVQKFDFNPNRITLPNGRLRNAVTRCPAGNRFPRVNDVDDLSRSDTEPDDYSVDRKDRAGDRSVSGQMM